MIKLSVRSLFIVSCQLYPGMNHLLVHLTYSRFRKIRFRFKIILKFSANQLLKNVNNSVQKYFKPLCILRDNRVISFCEISIFSTAVSATVVLTRSLTRPGKGRLTEDC